MNEVIIPKQLQNNDFRFLLLKEKLKKPIAEMTEWQTKNFEWDNPFLQNHLEKGGNYGIIGGYGNLILIDADSKEINEIAETLPETFTIKTGSPEEYKKHYLYLIEKPMKGIRLSDRKLGDLGDIRGVGQYIVAPNSIHPSGNKYEIIKDIPITKINHKILKESFLKYFNIGGDTELKEYPIETKKRSSEFIRECRVPDFVINNKLKENTSKNWQLFPYIVDILHNREVSKSVYQALVKRQGHSDSAIKGWVKKAHEGKLAKCSCDKMKEHLKHFHPEIINEICKNCPLNKETKEVEEFLMTEYNDNGEIKSQKVNIDKVADYLIKNFNFKTIFGSKNEITYLYENGIWNRKGREKIKTGAEKILGAWAKNNVVNEIFEKIKRQTSIDKEKFERDNINFIPIKNGLWDIKNKKLIQHSSEFYFKTIIPINYNQEAKCPLFIKFLKEALYPEDIPVIQEYFGFSLYRNYFIKKAIICLGETDTGKTILLESFINFIGDKNKTGLSLQKISSGNDFVKLSLKDKHLNVYDDLSSKDLMDGGNFKIATGGGNISGEEKFGDYVQFRNFAKHIFATNKIPPVKDNDDMAYYSRWMIIRFDNTPEKKDLFLKEKLANEIEGILIWALEGLYRLLDNGKFSYNKSPIEVKKIMEMSGDSLIQFGNEVLEKSEGNKITKEKMYETYIIWANKSDKPIFSKEQLGRNLNKKITYLIPKKDTKKRFWENAKIKIKWAEELKCLPLTQRKEDTLDTFKNFICRF